MNRIKHILFAIFILSTPAMSLDIQPLPKDIKIPKALYINCLQRTQTQQLLKLYIMKGLSSSYKNPSKELAEAIPAYDKRFWQFDTYFRDKLKDKEHIAYLDKAKKIWQQSKITLKQAPSKDNALILYDNFKLLVKYLGKAKVLAQKNFKAVGMTGGLCRDPLYMSNIYLMNVWGVELPNYKEDMDRFISHFNKNISKLEAYEKNTDETKKFIQKSKNAFMFFEISNTEDHTPIPTLISKKADDIFFYTRTLKKLYGKMLH